MTLPKTRVEAIALKEKKYFTGIPCKKGHMAVRYLNGECKDCQEEHRKTDAAKEIKKEYYKKNIEIIKKRALARPKEERKKHTINWRRAHPEKVKLTSAIRNKRTKQATPKWLKLRHKKQITAMYEAAILMTELMHELYVVDHIVPLKGKTVCGLHVPWNLRVITARENLIKSNKLIDSIL